MSDPTATHPSASSALFGSRPETISEEFAKYLMENFRRREDDVATLAVLREILATLQELTVLLTKPPPTDGEIAALQAKVASLTATLSGSSQQLQAATE